ncbi:MAG: RNA polymerase sigma factor [Agathobacter sp.]|nr:RNA polymerase sigma factor [Agathobacter sp.]
MIDEKIVQLYWDRDESAVAETQSKYGRYLTKIAYNILTDMEDSLESVNDTYLYAWKSIPPHRPSVLSTYLAKITRRVSIDILRKKSREKRIPSEYTFSLSELDDCVSSLSGTEQQIEAEELGKVINAYLKTISADARHLFIGRYFFMDSLKDVAKYCGMSEAKAKSMLYRTRCGLKIYLEQEGYYI